MVPGKYKRYARCVLDLVMAQEDGKYLIVKDPNKQMIRWVAVTPPVSSASVLLFPLLLPPLPQAVRHP